MPPQGGSQAPPAPPHYAQAPQYEHRPTLPLPPPQKTTLPPYQHPSNQYRMPSPPRINDAPREQNLQVTAQSAGAMVDPRISTTSARNPQGPLPALNAVTAGPPSSSLVADVPPSRGRSTTPPRSSHSDASTANAQPRSTLSSILHASKDYGTNSHAGGSPRAQPVEGGGLSEDNRALRMLDRSAFRQAVA
jgi:hypothetical protein